MFEHTILIHGKGRKRRLIYISCSQTWTNLLQWIKIRNKFEIHTDKVFVKVRMISGTQENLVNEIEILTKGRKPDVSEEIYDIF